MNKIRINELARELEVKAHEILDRLPELGVTEKKTHSSSIDEDVAIRLRRLLQDGGGAEEDHEPRAGATASVEEADRSVEATPVVEEAPTAVASQPQVQAPAPAAVEEKPAEPAAPKVTAPERPAGRPAADQSPRL